MPAASFDAQRCQPSRWLPWSLAGAAAAALGVVAVTAWRAADSQRRDGEGALRQAATEAAARAAVDLEGTLALVILQRKPFARIRTDWFQNPGRADDWIKGPWPQADNKLSRALREVQALRKAGKSQEAREAFVTEGNPLHGLGPFPPVLFEFPVPDRPAATTGQEEAIPQSTTPSGLPLGPLIIRERMLLGLENPRLQAFLLLKAATAEPSILTSRLVEEAAAALTEDTTPEEAAAIAIARTKAQDLEAFRTACQILTAETLPGKRWLDARWYLAAESDGEIPVFPLQQTHGIAERARTISKADGLPAGWSASVVLDGMPLHGPAPAPVQRMGTASVGPWRVEVFTREAEPFAALQHQLVRQRWLIGGAAGSIGAALGGFLLVLARQRRLNAMMSNFVASVSHELRAPIGSIGLLAERLGTGRVADTEEQSRYHHLIRGECRRLSGTIENVLSFSRLERGQAASEQELTDLTALVREAADLLRPLMEERHVILSTSFPDVPLECEVDPTAIRQAVLNLLDNALKFSPPGGTIRLSLTEADGEAIITVSDEGPGVPEGERVRIFEPFYRIGNELRRETPGIGIGLAIVRQAALAHGGSVSVADRTDRTDRADGTDGADRTVRQSRNDTGAVFELRLQMTRPVSPHLKPET